MLGFNLLLSVTSGVGIPTTSQIRGVFGHQCNPGAILPHLYVKNIVLAKKPTENTAF